jgi:Cu(I)/Ag(I) efflux system membrane fusion protein
MNSSLEKKASVFSRIVGKLWIAVLIAAMLCVGYWLGKTGFEPGQATTIDTAAKAQIWTCSMHPQIKLPKPGLCPICNMDLIPLTSDENETDAGMWELTVSESAAKLMDIEVAPVERKFVTATVRMVGKVDFDETNLAYITAWIPGRLDRLFVDYTGVPVREGDHMVSLYSPELISAQEELLQAIGAAKNVGDTESGVMQRMSESTAQAARDKLRLWGLTAEQITEIEKTSKVSDHMTIYAPTSGIVIHKNAVEGMYVKTGTRIYTIADLTKIWVKLDAYESDLEWLRYGQEVEFTTVSYPGRPFKGTISFIDPILDEKTRTVKVRVNVSNADGMLKPGMFVKAVVRSQVASEGRIMNADLIGKWICPMHPEIIKDSPGECDICQMPIVRTEDMGYVGDDPATVEKPLVIPVTAALVTGTRAIVYVKVPETEKPTFEGREIALGPRAGDYYLVRSGLGEGELVVVNGNFKIDAELQIRAKPSMMSPGPTDAHKGHEHIGKTEAGIDDAFRVHLSKVFNGYFSIQQALADDQDKLAIKSAESMLKALKGVEVKLLNTDHISKWNKEATELETTLIKLTGTKDIQPFRKSFYLLSEQMMLAAKQFGSTGEKPFYILHCPMAFDNTGANWIQTERQPDNPYFGAAMLRCGSVTEVIAVKDIWQKREK